LTNATKTGASQFITSVGGFHRLVSRFGNFLCRSCDQVDRHRHFLEESVRFLHHLRLGFSALADLVNGAGNFLRRSGHLQRGPGEVLCRASNLEGDAAGVADQGAQALLNVVHGICQVFCLIREAALLQLDLFRQISLTDPVASRSQAANVCSERPGKECANDQANDQ